MVARRWAAHHNRRGKSRMGCLLTVLVLAVVAYYGVPIGTVYLRYWRFTQEMESQARLAPSIDDAAIRRRVRLKAEELRLPEEAQQITIRRTLRPREILIRTSYEETIDLLFFNYTFTLTPEVRSPL